MPLAHESIMRAIELNGVQVEQNKAAFELGRRCRHDLASVESQARPTQVITFNKRKTLNEMLDERVRFLAEYQNEAYANVYRAFVEKVRSAEAAVGRNGTQLAETVARNLFKLMAYKDEYEVARLHTSPAFLKQIEDTFEGDYKLVHHMAPPMLSRRGANGAAGEDGLRPLDARRDACAGTPEAAARHGARSVRLHRRAPRRAGADRRVPGLHR